MRLGAAELIFEFVEPIQRRRTVASRGVRLPGQLIDLMLQLVHLRLRAGSLVIQPRFVRVAGDLRWCQPLGANRRTCLRNGCLAGRHVDVLGQLVVDTGRLGQKCAQLRLQLCFGHGRICFGDVRTRLGDNGIGRRVEFHPKLVGAVSQIGQLAFECLDVVCRPVGRPGHRECFSAVSVQVFARLVDGFFGGLRRVASPRTEGGKLRDAIGRFPGRFGATSGGVENLANVAAFQRSISATETVTVTTTAQGLGRLPLAMLV